ncbi:SRPBCC domain-containing protein [Oceaniglobus trochenteri]|uniref:SRPBCC domain-containing protein n=1 Tax=Oceaniglobus trochenteri TaxID=2763260 RepID=UPI001CFFB165|nr:SRPBCC domain-containing protein [Oceaniglobus trochenteri]
MADFETLTLEREIPCSPERLFHLITDRDTRQKWSAPDNDSVLIIDEYDLRPGGHEKIRCGPKDSPDFNTLGQFHVVTPEFFCLTETLAVGGETMSISLCSHEISATATGSLLRLTLQITSLVGPEMFKDFSNGWSASLANLAALASDNPGA